MEKIDKKDGVYYYGDVQCVSSSDAYQRFRDDYHRLLGKAVHLRLNRVGSRKERYHDFGFCFSKDVVLNDFGCSGKRFPYRLLGLVCSSYCWTMNCTDMPQLSDDDLWEWLDWAFSKGSHALRQLGKKDGVGRNARNIRKRYRQ